MKISIITACYNGAATIGTAIESVFAQRGVDVEYIVVDGGSTDGTAEMVKEYADKTRNSQLAARNCTFRWLSESDRGMYDAINKGIGMATGDVVGILNADDVLEGPDTLAHIAAAFGQGSDGRPEPVDCVYADIRFVREDLETTVRYYGAGGWRPWMHNWGYMPPHPSVYIRRELFKRLGGYRLGYSISADFELMVRYLCRNRVRAVYLPECVVKMRMGGKSTKNWRANVLLNMENVRANRENGYFSCFAMMLPKYLFKVWGFIFKK
ncbi:MAG: glycosyltransferase [Kiritimatiellae bacterium]|nr:glycosyltransferase [Kiritimatiellia bacterium]